MDPAVVPLTPQEERELHRVFDLLCGYQYKSHLQHELQSIHAMIDELHDTLAHSGSSKIVVDKARIEEDIEQLQCKSAEVQQQLQEIQSHTTNLITYQDVFEMLKRLGKKTSKREVQEMIWEVDEDLDDCVNWDEFKLMYQRNLQDQSGLEPSKLFHLAQFLIFDHNSNGLVSVDETMSMLYARFGRARMESKLKELFGEGLEETGKEGGEINFEQYSRAVENTQLRVFYESTQGRIVATKSGGKRLLEPTSLSSSSSVH